MLPSGDHVGFVLNESTWLVTFLTPVPSAFMTNTFPNPPLTKEKAIWLPSGDHAGSLSSADECVNGVGGSVEPVELTL